MEFFTAIMIMYVVSGILHVINEKKIGDYGVCTG